jgi:uncharacterized protein RhaS with RHS repeats
MLGTVCWAWPEKAAASPRYFHTDNLGSISIITDQTGAVAERDSYDAWGRRRLPTGAVRYART